MKKRLIRLLPGLIVLTLLLAHAARVLELPFVTSLDQVVYDIKLRATMPNTVDERIVVLDIDEKSLAEVGRWPWRRDKMAQLVDKLFDQHQIGLLGFDIVLAEPDDSAGLATLEQLGRRELKDDPQFQAAFRSLRPQLDVDQLFANALRKRPIVLGYYFANEGVSSGALPRPAVTKDELAGQKIRITSWKNFGANLPQFQANAQGAGHFNPIIDSDGRVRRVPLLVEHQGAYYESFSLAMARALLGSPKVIPGLALEDGYAAIEWIDLIGKQGLLRRLPVDGNVAALVPYRGYERSFRYYSAADILADRIKPGLLKDRVVIVGTSAPGLRDLRSTPVGEVYPGMEVHANLIAGMLDNTVMEKPQYVDAIELLLLLVAGLVMILLVPWRAPLRATLATLLVLLVMVGLNLGAWQAQLVLPLASLLLLITSTFVLNMSWGYFVESKAKRQITQRFGQYVPPELVDKMSLNPGSYSMASRKAHLTVLFSDVRDFTTISEGMEPEALAQLMNEYLTEMTLVIRQHRGTLDKYIGDAIVAFWGAPVADEDHARNGLMTALAMQKALVGLNQRLRERGWPQIAIGIGLNTGNMTVGDMGSSIRLAYTVMGDAVNLGARLEAKTKEYGVGIMVGAATRQAVPDIVYRELDCVQVKGKQEPTTIYEPIGLASEIEPATRQALELWSQVLAAYRARDWDRAESGLAALSAGDPGKRLYQIYQQRIAGFRAEPPPADWNGVTRFDSK
ncbi:CHASE2 domain-containing protein [Lacisediminimonas sp.]|uniref:CHASE2 domain-containing protein n=1 Tax=Lacisediminimonas sp. TaxID=3060582 RepID=UPI00271FE92D|nr:adenylate/guanylate cyclase domain-containing protein [Lacisediminimonas sp.]MDO8300214.1 adenylate/guanylate cyclase domain-containing protein [Lacisediminimonas sp.]